MDNYNKQANKFCKKYEVTIKKEFLKNDCYFDSDKDKRDIYTITISRPNKKDFVFTFGQCFDKSDLLNKISKYRSRLGYGFVKCNDNYFKTRVLKELDLNPMYINLKNSEVKELMIPDDYNILSCLTKYNPYDFDNFCFDYGYDTDSRKALDLYLRVQKEYNETIVMFSDCLKQLQKIE